MAPIDRSTAERKAALFRQKYGEAHWYLACHAAFPLALSPNLLYRIWANFQRDTEGRLQQIPWVAVSDFLLSGMCSEVAYELYELDLATRSILLSQLVSSPGLGAPRLRELGAFLLDYASMPRHSLEQEARDLAQAHRWVALAYLQPAQAGAELAAQLAGLPLAEKAEWVRVAGLLEHLAQPLTEASLEPLLVYAGAMSALAKGDSTRSASGLLSLPVKDGTFSIAGVQLPVPDVLMLGVRRGAVPKPVAPPVTAVTIQTPRLTRKWLSWNLSYLERQIEQYSLEISSGVTLDFSRIPGGIFSMGSASNDKRFAREQPLHSVEVPTFFMSRNLISQEQWRSVAQMQRVKYDLDPEPSRFADDRLPVEGVTWRAAIEFCERLRRYSGHLYRLPSEAEWEYACRAGTMTAFNYGPTLSAKLACYDASNTFAQGPAGWSPRRTVAVGSLNAPNDYGLYDMHGNVWEWCADYWHETYHHAPNDGSAWISNESNQYRVVRGGSWIDGPAYCRSTYRNGVAPGTRGITIGFRIVATFTEASLDV